MRKAVLALSGGLFIASLGFGQVDIVTDEDALFGDDTETVEAVEAGKEGEAVKAFLKTEAVRIGGIFSGSVGGDWKMNDPWGETWGPKAVDDYGLSTVTAGSLFFDARPDEAFRVYGKMKASWPFETSKTFLTDATYSDPDDDNNPFTNDEPRVTTTEGSISVPNLEVFELFADWNYKDALFLRFGKHTVKWGVGYFFSPADVINVGRIDPENPTEQLEGPVSLRLHYPIPNSQNNLWAYAVMPQGEDPKPEDIAAAAKYEFLLGKGWEIGLGGFYRYDSIPRGMITASGSFWKLNLFGEAVGAFGSEKSFVTDVSFLTPGFVSTEKREDELFFSGTAGFSYSDSEANLSLAAQYLYSGEGYADADRESLIDDARANESGIKAALTAAGLPASTFDSLVKGLIYNSGRHYAALSLTKSELFLEDLSASVFAMANLSDFSGMVTPSLSWELFDRTSLKASASFVFGGEDSEYVVLNDGASLTLSLKASLGSGNF